MTPFWRRWKCSPRARTWQVVGPHQPALSALRTCVSSVSAVPLSFGVWAVHSCLGWVAQLSLQMLLAAASDSKIPTRSSLFSPLDRSFVFYCCQQVVIRFSVHIAPVTGGMMCGFLHKCVREKRECVWAYQAGWLVLCEAVLCERACLPSTLHYGCMAWKLTLPANWSLRDRLKSAN